MPDSDRSDLGRSPTRIDSRALRREIGKAFTWGIVIGLLVLAVYISQSLLVIFGAMVFGALIDGGARLLARILPIARGFRIAIVLLLTVAFLLWLGYFAGSQISQQAAQFPSIVTEQIGRTIGWLQSRGFAVESGDIRSFAGSLACGVGTVTQAIGGVVGGRRRRWRWRWRSHRTPKLDN